MDDVVLQVCRLNLVAADLTEGTPEYDAKLNQARAKFEQKYGSSTVTAQTPENTAKVAKVSSPEDIQRAVELKSQGNAGTPLPARLLSRRVHVQLSSPYETHAQPILVCVARVVKWSWCV